MIPYILLIAGVILIAIVSRFVFKNSDKGELIQKILVVGFTFLFIYVIASLKAISVGNDTEAYFLGYQRATSASFLNYKEVGFEIGFSTLMQIFAKMRLPFTAFLLFINIPIYGSLAYLFIKKSPYPLLSCIIYICFSLLTFNMSAIRQSLAIAIGIISYFALDVKKNWLKVALFVALYLLAVSIHTSAFILVFIPLLKFVKINKKISLLFVLIAFLLFIVSEYVYGFIFYNIIGQRTYAPGSYGGGGLFILIMLFYLFMIVFQDVNSFSFGVDSFFSRFDRKIFKRKAERNDGTTNDLQQLTTLFLVMIFTQAFCRVNVNFPRFGFFFLPFLFVSLPQTISLQNSKTFRILAYGSVLVFFLLFFVKYSVFGDSLNTIPYRFIFG